MGSQRDKGIKVRDGALGEIELVKDVAMPLFLDSSQSPGFHLTNTQHNFDSVTAQLATFVGNLERRATVTDKQKNSHG